MSPLGRRVDAHHHVWDLAVRDQPWTAEIPALRRSFSLDDLEPELARAGIGSSVVVQTVCVAAETPELLELAEHSRALAGVVGWVDLTAVDVHEQLDRLRTLPGGTTLVGVRHQVQDEPDPAWLCRADVQRGLTAVADAGLAFDLLVRPHQLAAALSTVRAIPHLRFILDHAGKPVRGDAASASWRESIEQLAALGNVCVKLSGLVTEAGAGWTVDRLRPVADHLSQCFGPSRVMFGSDWPTCLAVATYAQVVEAAQSFVAELTSAESDAVFGGTARRWYGLAP
ncbi:MAG: amidohydrolase family protein [Jatrophihabitans sp.]|uniref:amidohydrolase family protein n=1 Tax=Jatrophihabitans sp. TaxID=1932789 RepID=UPI003F7E480C